MSVRGYPSGFSALIDELDRWQARTNRRAAFWWRDDDATGASERLARLIRIGAEHAVPFALAIIPARLGQGLVEPLARAPWAVPIQHGYAHTNHAPRLAGRGSWELGSHRPAQVVLEELRRGKEILSDAFGERFLPVMAAPWNRVCETLFPGMRDLGYVGVSASGPRPSAEPVRGLRRVNIHCDILKWTDSGPRYRRDERVAHTLVAHLAGRRTGAFDADEPTGILSHHLVLDESSWVFLERFAPLVAAHPAARWMHPREVFGAGDDEASRRG